VDYSSPWLATLWNKCDDFSQNAVRLWYIAKNIAGKEKIQIDLCEEEVDKSKDLQDAVANLKPVKKIDANKEKEPEHEKVISFYSDPDADPVSKTITIIRITSRQSRCTQLMNFPRGGTGWKSLRSLYRHHVHYLLMSFTIYVHDKI
jgi:hypothetical protein